MIFTFIENTVENFVGLAISFCKEMLEVFQEEMLFDFNQVSEFKELTLIGGHLADDISFDLSIDFLTQHQEELDYLISNVVGFENFTTAFSDSRFSQFKTVFQPTHRIGA